MYKPATTSEFAPVGSESGGPPLWGQMAKATPKNIFYIRFYICITYCYVQIYIKMMNDDVFFPKLIIMLGNDTY